MRRSSSSAARFAVLLTSLGVPTVASAQAAPAGGCHGDSVRVTSTLARQLQAPAEAAGLKVDANEVSMLVQAQPEFLHGGQFSEEQYLKTLGEQLRTTRLTYETDLKAKVLASRLLRTQKLCPVMMDDVAEDTVRGRVVYFAPEALVSEVKVTPAEALAWAKSHDTELRASYSRRKEEFWHEERVRVRQVFIRAPHEPPPHLREDIASGKLSFEDAVTKYSEDELTVKNKGALGWLHPDWHPAVRTAALALGVGKLSGWVTTPYGHHLLEVQEHKDKRQLTFDAAKLELATEALRLERAQALAKERAATLAAQAKKHPHGLAGLLPVVSAKELPEGRPLHTLVVDTGDFEGEDGMLPGLGLGPDLVQALQNGSEREVLTGAFAVKQGFAAAERIRRQQSDGGAPLMGQAFLLAQEGTKKQ